MIVRAKEYLTSNSVSPYGKWFNDLRPDQAAKVTTAVVRMEGGNFSNVKSVGGGVSEYKIDYGPGLRIYFAMEGQTIILLLGGGTKRRQEKDIGAAKQRWSDHKDRKKEK